MHGLARHLRSTTGPCRLQAEGEKHGRKRIARLMRGAGLVGACHRKGGPTTTRRDQEARPAPDLVDGAGWHVGDGLVVPDDISPIKLPPYAPELNPIENLWASLRGTKLAHQLFDTCDDLVTACCDAWNTFIADENTVRSITTRQWATCQKL